MHTNAEADGEKAKMELLLILAYLREARPKTNVHPCEQACALPNCTGICATSDLPRKKNRAAFLPSLKSPPDFGFRDASGRQSHDDGR